MIRIEKAGGYQLKITGQKQGVNKKGGVWILFDAVDTQSMEETKLMFGLANKENDSKKAFEIKTKIWSEFVKNCGVDKQERPLDEILDDLMGKEVKCVLRLKEKVIFGKEDDKPMIVNNIEYYYSVSMDKQMQTNPDKLFTRLNDWENNFYEEKFKAWEKKNGGGNTADEDDEFEVPKVSADPDDGLPF